jgi:hypothetical protein
LQRFSARLALAFGLLLAVAEVARNWGDWQWWPFWLVDFVAAGLLVAGALATLRHHPRGPVWLTGAWGFTSAMFYMSFWSHVASLHEPVGTPPPESVQRARRESPSRISSWARRVRG